MKRWMTTAMAALAASLLAVSCDGESGKSGTSGEGAQSAAPQTQAADTTAQKGEPEANASAPADAGTAGQADQNAPAADSAKAAPEASAAKGFVSIPKGRFAPPSDGAADASEGFELEAFQMSEKLVSAAEFKKCVEAGKCPEEEFVKFKPDSSGDGILSQCSFGREGHGDYPMNCVSWRGAALYCKFIGGRLPTLAEWEYAATHDGKQPLWTKYPWGDAEPVHCKTAAFRKSTGAGMTYYCAENGRTADAAGPRAIGAYSPAGDSPLGLKDMTGSVSQWTLGTAGTGTIVQGGSWAGDFEQLAVLPGKSRAENGTQPSDRIGFRCIKGGLPRGVGPTSDGYIALPDGVLHSKMGNSVPQEIQSFEMAVRPVTVDEFAKCVEAGKCSKDGFSSWSKKTSSDAPGAMCRFGRPGYGDHPMNCVDWSTAASYCRFAGGRLPTLYEWEYAASHDGALALQTAFPWGDDDPVHCRTANFTRKSDSGQTYYCSGKSRSMDKEGTAPVGTYAPANNTPLGLVDMSGNIAQWTATTAGDPLKFFFKGGDYTDDIPHLQIAPKSGSYVGKKASRYPTTGIRCARGGAANASSVDPMSAPLPWSLPKNVKAEDLPKPTPKNGIAVVDIPAGEYTGRRSKKTEKVGAFRMGKYPVSLGEYAACVMLGGCDMRRHHALYWDQAEERHKKFCNLDTKKENMPANCVDQAGAAEYCKWVGGRLPTDTEWKYAATHDGTKVRGTDYPWGDKAFQKHCVNASYLQFSGNGPKGSGNYYCDGKKKVLTPAGTSLNGSYSPAGDSPLGLADMCGNVGEWTSTLLPDDKAAVNGGGWDQNVVVMEVDSKTAKPQTPLVTARDPTYGFRCVWPAK